MVDKRIDIPTNVVEESIRRMIDQIVDDIDAGLVDISMVDPVQKLIDPGQLKRLAALNIAMTRIISSVSTN